MTPYELEGSVLFHGASICWRASVRDEDGQTLTVDCEVELWSVVEREGEEAFQMRLTADWEDWEILDLCARDAVERDVLSQYRASRPFSRVGVVV